MRAGQLRHRLKLQEATETRDGHGGITRDWETYTVRWGSVEPLRGRELFAAQQVNAEITHRVRLRHCGDLTTSHRLVLGTCNLNILSILNPEERNRELEVMCKEAV